MFEQAAGLSTMESSRRDGYGRRMARIVLGTVAASVGGWGGLVAGLWLGGLLDRTIGPGRVYDLGRWPLPTAAVLGIVGLVAAIALSRRLLGGGTRMVAVVVPGLGAVGLGLIGGPVLAIAAAPLFASLAAELWRPSARGDQPR